MTPGLRRANLTLHVVSSVGWLGAAVGFLVLSVVGQWSRVPETVRAVYVAMDIIGLSAIVPLAIASFLTGVVQALGTPWGLFRYYWVVTKLVLTIGATAVLMLHQFTAVARAAQRVSLSAPGALPDVGQLGSKLVFASGFGIVVLLVMTILSVFKPWGRIRSTRGEPSAAAADGAVPISGSTARENLETQA
ncbi:MAG TPA: hypothetical protein VH559_09665 [Gemmatimonadaceae bacterium]|jgi:hypothetical protein